MATFVLVHGGWHGGWCWKRVTPLLRAAGHDVYAPNLTGLGERSHLLTRDVGLDTHVQDVAKVLEFEQLDGVVLVGHSYGGMVIAGVADLARRRIRRLVYLDAFVPGPGQSMFDLVKPERRAFLESSAVTGGEGWLVPPPSGSPLFGISDERDLAWVRTPLSPHPLLSFQQPVSAAGEAERSPGAFILCSTGQSGTFASLASRLSGQPGRTTHQIKTGHDAMVTKPNELADLLLQIA